MERTGTTNLALARRSVDPDTGEELLPQWIRHLAENRVPRSPELWRYRALAAGMGVDVEKIKRLAAAQWIGVELAEVDQGEWITVPMPPELSEEDRQVVLETAITAARSLARRKNPDT
ncbi:hypothetical protein ACWEU6_36125 [Streptosporangium sandarakinum]